MLLRLPLIGDPFVDYQMIGFGDIAVPGLLVAYLLRFDSFFTDKPFIKGYFAPAVVGYSLGMVATFVALTYMQKAQQTFLM